MKQVLLKDIAHIIRSKNSGPYELTLDIFFKEQKVYRHVKERNAITRSMIMQLYRIQEHQILDIIYFDPVNAVKITIARPVASGAITDTDIYGAQQHMPLVTASIEIGDEL